jgi:hypothetical protein
MRAVSRGEIPALRRKIWVVDARATIATTAGRAVDTCPPRGGSMLRVNLGDQFERQMADRGRLKADSALALSTR